MANKPPSALRLPLPENPAALSSSAWLDGSTAPKDGTEIVAIGRVIYDDDCTTTAERFVAAVRWMEVPWRSVGWHITNALTVAQTLDDEVIVDYWQPMPSNRGAKPRRGKETMTTEQKLKEALRLIAESSHDEAAVNTAQMALDELEQRNQQPSKG